MKCKIGANILLYILTAVLLCIILYPHTRFAHTDQILDLGDNHLNRSNVKLKVGESFYLYIDGINKRASYKSSDFKVASVRFTGKVKAHRKGTAIITVKQKDLRLTCKVTVIE
jgi:hypothetical protein